MKYLVIVFLVFGYSNLLAQEGQTYYSEGVTYMKIENDVIVCRIPNRKLYFSIVYKNEYEYTLKLLDLDTGEKTSEIYKLILSNEVSRLDLIGPKGKLIQSYFSEETNPYKVKTYVLKTTFQIKDYSEFKLLTIEILSNGKIQISDSELNVIKNKQLNDEEIMEYEKLLNQINISSINGCGRITDISHASYYAINFVEHDLKQNVINFQVIPYLLEDIVKFIRKQAK